MKRILLALLVLVASPASAIEFNPFASYEIREVGDVTLDGAGAGFFLTEQISNNVSFIGEATFANVKTTDIGSGESSTNIRDYRYGIQLHKFVSVGSITYLRAGAARFHGLTLTDQQPVTQNDDGLTLHLGLATGTRNFNIVLEAGYLDAEPVYGPEAGFSMVFRFFRAQAFLMGRYGDYTADAPSQFNGSTFVDIDQDYRYGSLRFGFMKMF